MPPLAKGDVKSLRRVQARNKNLAAFEHSHYCADSCPLADPQAHIGCICLLLDGGPSDGLVDRATFRLEILEHATQIDQ
jgi:hypothetical protein